MRSLLSLLLIGSGAVAAAAHAAEPATIESPAGIRLVPGATAATDLAADRWLVAVLAVRQGDYAQVTVTSSIETTVIRLLDPDGTVIAAFSPRDFLSNSVTLTWIANETHDYTVQVDRDPKATAGRQMTIAVAPLRAATDADTAWFKGQLEYHHGLGLQVSNGSAFADVPAAVQHFTRAREAFQHAGARRLEALSNWQAGRVYFSEYNAREAMAEFDQALNIFRELGDRRGEGVVLLLIGNCHLVLSDFEQAIAFFQQSLDIRRAIDDKQGEARAIGSLANTFWLLGQFDRAQAYAQDALVAARAAHDEHAEAQTLNILGIIHQRRSRYDDAVRYFTESLAVAERIGETRLTGALLNNLGNIYFYNDNRYNEALQLFARALEVNQQTGDRLNQGLVLRNMASVYQAFGEYEVALGYLQRALVIQREIDDRHSETITLSGLAEVSDALHDYAAATEFQERGLALAIATGDRWGEAVARASLGRYALRRGDAERAEALLAEALVIHRDVGNRHGEAATLASLATLYRETGRPDKAIMECERALVVAGEIHARDVEAACQLSIGSAFVQLGRHVEADESFEMALRVYSEIGDRSGEGEILHALMSLNAESTPRLAVFYGKQSVNLVQAIRADIRGLPDESQRSFLEGNATRYHLLADLLVGQGRLAEAEQVLNMLKEEEFLDFVRRDPVELAGASEAVALTPEEAGWERRYREIGERLVTLGSERSALLQKKALAEDERQRLATLEADLAVGNQAFETFLDELAEHFRSDAGAGQRVAEFREAEGLMQDLRELPTGTVAIYTLLAPDRYRSILITPDTRKAYEYPITAADLNRKVLGFRQVLANPALDPVPAAQELYDILVRPLAGDLRQADAHTIMWSLDGTLRYLPLAALHDGARYLVEEFGLAVFTPTSNARLKDRPIPSWTAAGFGVTKPHADAPPLPAVAAELNGIIAAAGGDGVLKGTIALDEQFTLDAFRGALTHGYPVVHVASHFRLQPGDQGSSYLLLGDGSRLKVADIQKLSNPFGGVQLLTLSACNTGVAESEANGTEVEGFGVLAQRKGAKAVLASLWAVSDASTSLLMREFYRVRETTPGMTKLEALRAAQLALLHGEAAFAAGGDATRGFRRMDVDADAAPATPALAADPTRPYAHPYHWAPFFLMGNWL